MSFRFGFLFAAGLAIAALIVFLVRGGGSGDAAVAPQAKAKPAIAVPVAPVVSKTVPVYLEYAGTTDAIRSVTLQAQATGYLLGDAVPDGADVSKGQLLYRIDPRSYRAALDRAQAQVQRDAAALQYAAANQHRNLLLGKAGDVSVDMLQQSTNTAQQAEAALAADRAAVETAELNLGYTEIRAPFAGRLSRSDVHEGALISTAGTQINTLVQLDPIYVTFNPPDSDLAEIRTYQAESPVPADVMSGTGKPRNTTASSPLWTTGSIAAPAQSRSGRRSKTRSAPCCRGNSYACACT